MTTPKLPPLPPSAAKAACAACKHQRRRCAPDCPLAPYFTADRQADFNNVHRLFGINNVLKLLKKVAPRDRDDAVKSLVYEANLRATHPVGGCFAAIAELLRQIDLCKAQLKMVTQNLAVYKQMQNLNAHHLNQSPLIFNNQEMDFRIQEIVQQFFNDKPTLPDQ